MPGMNGDSVMAILHAANGTLLSDAFATMHPSTASRHVQIGLPEILGLFVFLAAGWLVWDALKARETANDAMRAACEALGYFFLDDTVSLQSVRPRRDDDGHLRLLRAY